MKKTTMLLLAILCMIPAASISGQVTGADTDDSMFLFVEANLMVFDRREAAKVLGDWADAVGGYFTHQSDDLVVMRVPDSAAEEFREMAEGVSESIISYGRSNVDIRQDLMRSESILESREEILARNLELLDQSDVEGTLELEKEIRRLMREIDNARGRLRKLKNDAVMSLVHVNLSFRTQSVPDYRPSSFEWINNVDFYDFLAGYGRYGARRISGDPVSLPDGFAPLDDRKSVSGISPEGIRYRLVQLDNYPEQETGFWSEALENDLAGRGYIEMPPEMGLPVLDEDSPFTAKLWGIPVGEEDYLYLTALRVAGKRIELVEMAGPAELMSGYLK